ncbi:MAG: (2Fe-2S) ferredoxin domain-containing protein [Planctomycetes bacterium]|nr:(2Fe-2S) ferredoxin domain-containing protein [Planctomycetota bacterium]
MSDDKLVYVCEGGDCSEKGSVELYEELKAMLENSELKDHIRLRKYPCFGGCEHGINVTVWPDRVFYSKVGKADLEEVKNHIEGGEPVKRLCGIVKPDVEDIIWEILDSPY